MTDEPDVDRWLYSVDGKPAYYERELQIFSAESHQCEYWVREGWIYCADGGKAAYFILDDWVYDLQGRPAYRMGPAEKLPRRPRSVECGAC